jgi:hypothetical protein
MYSTYDIHNFRELRVSHLFAAEEDMWQGCCVSVQDWVQIGREYQHLADIDESYKLCNACVKVGPT